MDRKTLRLPLARLPLAPHAPVTNETCLLPGLLPLRARDFGRPPRGSCHGAGVTRAIRSLSDMAIHAHYPCGVGGVAESTGTA